jgi:hypothetical protein
VLFKIIKRLSSGINLIVILSPGEGCQLVDIVFKPVSRNREENATALE